MRKLGYLMIFLAVLTSGCSSFNDQDDGVDAQKNGVVEFSKRWKAADKKQRSEMLDINQLYEWLKGKSKKEVELLLGEPDAINSNGDYIFFIGFNNVEGYVYEKECRICFDNGAVVVRIEVDKSKP